MSLSVYRVREALYTRLTAGAGTATVYWQVAPDSAALPCVVFDLAGDAAVANTLGSSEAFVDYPVLVRAMASDTPRTAEDLYAAVHDALLSTPLAVTGGTAIGVQRRTVVTYDEATPGGGFTYHAGGRYSALIRG